MRLHVETMGAILVEVDEQGRIRFDKEEWAIPTLQERRAILHAAENEIAELRELVERLDDSRSG